MTSVIHISDTGQECHAKEGNTMSNITKITRVSQESRRVYQEVHQQYQSLSQHTSEVTVRHYQSMLDRKNRLAIIYFKWHPLMA